MLPMKSSPVWDAPGRCLPWSTFKVNAGYYGAVAKGIASGLPLGAMIARAKIMNWEAGSHASTFRRQSSFPARRRWRPLNLLENNMMKNAEKQGNRLLKGLNRSCRKSYECMGDVRGKGLMVAIELVKDRETKEPATKLRPRIIKRAFEKGLLVLGCGENSIRFCPSLSVKAGEVDTCLTIFEEAMIKAGC